MPEGGVSRAMTIPSDPSRFRSVREWLCGVARDQGWSERDALDLALAANEACANIHRHAYSGRLDGTIRIRLQVEGGSFRLTIRDRGIEFGEQDYALPDLEHPGEGGYGVFLILTLMDQVEYVRRGTVNELHLRKKQRSDAGYRQECSYV